MQVGGGITVSFDVVRGIITYGRSVSLVGFAVYLRIFSSLSWLAGVLSAQTLLCRTVSEF